MTRNGKAEVGQSQAVRRRSEGIGADRLAERDATTSSGVSSTSRERRGPVHRRACAPVPVIGAQETPALNGSGHGQVIAVPSHFMPWYTPIFPSAALWTAGWLDSPKIVIPESGFIAIP